MDNNERSLIFHSIDKLMTILPPYESFFLNYQLKFIDITPEQKKKFPNIENAIRIELLELGYITCPPKVNSIFTLTDIGRLVKAKGGYFKYLKSLEPKKDWYKIIPIILAFIFGTTTVVFAYLNYRKPNKEIEILKKENDSLKQQIKILYHNRISN